MGYHSLPQVLSYCKGVMISLPWSDYITNATMLRQRESDSLLGHEEVSCNIVRLPCGKELQVASRGWEWPSTNSQQENKILISTAPRKLMLPTAWLSFEADSSPVNHPDDHATWLTPWQQSCEIQSRGLSKVMPRILTHRNCEIVCSF